MDEICEKCLEKLIKEESLKWQSPKVLGMELLKEIRRGSVYKANCNCKRKDAVNG